jgi:NHL repeat
VVNSRYACGRAALDGDGSAADAGARAVAATNSGRPQYVVMTVAGVPGLAGFHDGRSSEATFDKPTWLDVHVGAECSFGTAGDIYVVDRVNQAVRIISGNSVSTFTTSHVTPAYAYTFDFGGPFGGGILMEPRGAGCGCSAYDSGFFVAASGQHEVALLSFVGSIALRDAIVIIGRSTVGSIDYGKEPLRMPTGLARSPNYNGVPPVKDPYDRVRDRLLYIADSGNHTIRRVHWGLSAEACPLPSSIETYTGLADTPGSADGPAPVARFNAPRGVATAADGSLYVADSGNHTIRRIAVDGTVTTVAGEAGVPGSNDGPARQAHLNTPSGIDVNTNGEVFIADTGNHTIRMVTTDGMLVTIAGSPGLAGFADGSAAEARFSGPVGLRIAPDETIVVADTSNHVIRRLFLPSARRRAVR